MKRKTYGWLALALAAAFVSSAAAQEVEVKKRIEIDRQRPGGDVMVWNMEAPHPPGMSGDGTFVFVGAEGGAMAQNKNVKGAPYSAEAVTETIQNLSDGNRIVRKNNTLLYRDAEGRTRREAVLGNLGPWASAGEPPRMITIVDPVAGVSYTLNPRMRTAMKFNFGPTAGTGFTVTSINGATVFGGNGNGAVTVHVPGEGPGPMRQKIETRVITHDGAAAGGPNANGPKVDRKEEDLGTQTVEGVSAKGKRTTTTFPAGFFGNERPLSVVDERWYSDELQMVIMTKHSDPRSGETTYRLTNINRANPDSSFFLPPADYKIEEPKMRAPKKM